MASDRRRPPLTSAAAGEKPAKPHKPAEAALAVARPKAGASVSAAAKASPSNPVAVKPAAKPAQPVKASKAPSVPAGKAPPAPAPKAAAEKKQAPVAAKPMKAPVAKPHAYVAAPRPLVSDEGAAALLAPKPASAAKTSGGKATAAKAAAAHPVDKPPRQLPPGSYVLEDQIGFQLRRAHQRATNIFHDVMARFDVTPTQFAALAKIDDEAPISQNHLGRLTAMDPSTILGVVGRLQRQGLIQLRSTPGDARLTMIELTAEGKTKVGEMKAVALNVSKQTLAPLSEEEAKALTDLLRRIG